MSFARSNGAGDRFLNVCNNQDLHGSDIEVKDIYAYGAGLHSPNAILGLSEFTNLQTLSLHGNQIERIEGLEMLHELVTLNLSSNNITWMEGLSQLKSLRVLNLSNNRIREIAGLQGLVAIRTLILSHNDISLLGGLSALQGLPYALQHLDLRDNLVEYLCELWILGGCSHLEKVVFQCGGYANPVCKASAYRSAVLSVVPHLRSMDGSSCEGHVLRSNVDMFSVSPLCAIHHRCPQHQTIASPMPAALRSCLRDQNASRSPYSRPTIVLRDTDGDSRCRTMPDGRLSEHFHFCCKSLQRETDSYLAHCLQKTHFLLMTTEQPKSSTKHAKSEHNLHHTVIPNYLQQGARGSAHANAEHLVVDAFAANGDVSPWWESSEHEVVSGTSGTSVLDFKALPNVATVYMDGIHSNGVSYNVHTRSKPIDKENLGISFAGAAGADISRFVRFDSQNCKSALRVGTALNDASHQKERAKRTLVFSAAALDEQHSKFKIVLAMLKNFSHQGIRSRRVCNRLNSELDLVCQVQMNFRNKGSESEDLTGGQSALWQARGREEAEKESQQLADELHRRLVITQSIICQCLKDNAKTLSSVSKLRDMMNEKMSELRKAFEAVIEKERGAKELIKELSFIASARKMRSEWMEIELVRLATSKREVGHLQAEILRLQERSSATEQKAGESEALKCELANVTSFASADPYRKQLASSFHP